MVTDTNLPDRVRLVEVGPRDGLQNEQKLVPAETKPPASRVARALAARDASTEATA